MVQTITINIPEGYDGVKFNKDTNQIEFIKEDRPKSWDEYCKKVKNTGCYSAVGDPNEYCKRLFIARYYEHFPQFYEFDTPEEAKAFIALGKLIQLHKAWIGDWKPDWQADNYKYVIDVSCGEIHTSCVYYVHRLLAFPTKEMRDEFLNTFRDLIKEAKPFL